MDELTLTVTLSVNLDRAEDAEEIRAHVLETLLVQGWDARVGIQSVKRETEGNTGR